MCKKSLWGNPRELLLAFPVKQAVSRSRGGRCHPETGYYNDDCDDDNDDCDDEVMMIVMMIMMMLTRCLGCSLVVGRQSSCRISRWPRTSSTGRASPSSSSTTMNVQGGMVWERPRIHDSLSSLRLREEQGE